MSKNQPRPQVAVVIPNYNGLKLLKKHLPAVFNTLSNGDQVIIVDDDSSDDSVSWLSQNFKLKKVETSLPNSTQHTSQIKHKNFHFTLDLLINHHNLRFGETVNKAFRLAKHQLVFLINNDVKPKPEALAHLTPYFVESSNARAAHVFAVGCLEKEPTSTGEIIEGGKNTLRFDQGIFQHQRAKTFTAGATAWVSGGSGLFNRDKWLELGGFDSAYYPAYWEDIDLSFRARQKGWLVLFDPQAVVEHHHETTNKDVFGQQQMLEISWKNADKFAWKNGNIWQKLSFLLWRPFWKKARFNQVANLLES
jgi:GT2 family glycosyltransferase